jgi:hypothetical protein
MMKQGIPTIATFQETACCRKSYAFSSVQITGNPLSGSFDRPIKAAINIGAIHAEPVTSWLATVLFPPHTAFVSVRVLSAGQSVQKPAAQSYRR